MDKSVEELAKLGQQSLQTAEKLGKWGDNVFGRGLRHIAGAFEDSMAGFRVRNRIAVLQKTKKAIEDAGMSEHIKPLDPRIGVKMLEAIDDESDETLQNVWAAYIAFTVNPENPDPDRLIIDVIKRLEPADWEVLSSLFKSQTSAPISASEMGEDINRVEAAMDRFVVLGLFIYDDPHSAYIVSGEHYAGAVAVKISDASYYETKLFRRLKAETKTAWSAV